MFDVFDGLLTQTLTLPLSIKMFAFREEVMSRISRCERKKGYSNVKVCDMLDPCYSEKDGEYGLYGPELDVGVDPTKYILLGVGLCRGVRKMQYNSETVYTICGKKGCPMDHRRHCVVDDAWKRTGLEERAGFCEDCWDAGAWGAPYAYYLPINVENSDYACLWLDSYLILEGMPDKQLAWKKKRLEELAEKKKLRRLSGPF